jgi:hypothetical protein
VLRVERERLQNGLSLNSVFLESRFVFSRCGRPSNREIGVFGLHGFGGRQQHSGADGGVRSLFNQNERAGEPIGVVAVINNRLGGFQADDADVAKLEK